MWEYWMYHLTFSPREGNIWKQMQDRRAILVLQWVLWERTYSLCSASNCHALHIQYHTSGLVPKANTPFETGDNCTEYFHWHLSWMLYRTKPRDCRHYAVVYIFLWVANLLLFFTNPKLYILLLCWIPVHASSRSSGYHQALPKPLAQCGWHCTVSVHFNILSVS